ncbi:MAG: FHA domain-containing protein [Nocardiaceae bacterium]|nr:FHA domain-containing protein [Nocardiaceae bacterium]
MRAMRESFLRFGLLGTLIATVDQRQVPLGTPKQRAVLAMLLVNRNRTVTTDSLIGAIWADSAASSARASIHTYVSNLRGLLVTAGCDGNAVLMGVSSGYRLNVAEGHLDLDQFVAEKNAGLQAAAVGSFDSASRRLSAALAQWRGAVLEDLTSFSFLEPFGTALGEDRLLVQTARAQAEIACERAYSVIAELESLVAEHPYREQLWAQLVTAYYLTDRQSDALAAYQRLRRALAEDLGIDPSPPLNALHQQVLRQERLDVRRTAKKAAALTAATSVHTAFTRHAAKAALRDRDGRQHRLKEAATSIGRLPENDIVIDDAKISRRHAVIIDTGSSFVITDLGSTNGVEVEGQKIRPSATLANGQRIRVGRHEFIFEVEPS